MILKVYVYKGVDTKANRYNNSPAEPNLNLSGITISYRRVCMRNGRPTFSSRCSRKVA